jgi:hypothetical protein
MPTSELFELIMQELMRVQERAESLRALEYDAKDDSVSASRISAQIEAAAQKIRKMILEYEQLDKKRPA